MQVLLEKQQIKKARQILLSKGASIVDSPIQGIMRKLGLLRGMAVGDMSKSWDVYSTIDFLENHVQKKAPILDIGCYASELIVALHKLGYSNLTGADLNPDISNMPYQGSIRYIVSDFMHTKFADCSFQAITSISVIEHGFDSSLLLQEMSRLLKPYGYFIASFDYWPEKVDTSDTKFFGMDWMVFSKNDITNFIVEAESYGLFPVEQMMYDGKDRVIVCGGKKYTFAWLSLQKRT
jgi:SAM-dependent methyltransferase